VLTLAGAAQSLQFSAYNTVAYADIPQDRMSAATSLYSTMQQIMLSAGICIAAGTLTVLGRLHHNTPANMTDFAFGFVVTGGISLLAVPLCAALSPSAGANMSGNRR
jgi:radical SAM superfamily enzyme with C-terminal helix-hairpin-helix motif